MADITNVALSGMYAAQMGLSVTSNNISNASTPGYNREVMVQTEATSVGTGAGFLGTGTAVETVQRQYSAFLTQQLQQQQSVSSQLTTNFNQIQQINNVIGDPTVGLTTSLGNFFSSASALATNPASVTTRQSMISNAQALTGSFQSLGQLFSNLNTNTNQQIQSTVATINSDAQLLAQINQNIATSAGTANGQPPNSLLDQRDQLITQLNQQVKVMVSSQPDGSYDVYMSNGQPLVTGSQSMTLGTAASASNPSQQAVTYTTPNGTQVQIPDRNLQGGALGGLIGFRTQTLVPDLSALGRIAVGLATSFNQQFQLGQDQNGNLGGAFFSFSGPQITANANNTGSESVAATITSPSALSGSNYTLTYNGSAYTLVRSSDSQTTTYSSLPQTVDGLNITMTGTPKPGDIFLIQPTASAPSTLNVVVTDPSRIAAAAPVTAATGTNLFQLQATAGSGNSGSTTMTAPAVTTPSSPNPNVQDNVLLNFTSPTSYTAQDTTTGLYLNGTGGTSSSAVALTYTSGASVSFNGWSSTLTGTPVSGDSFNVAPSTQNLGNATIAAPTISTASLSKQVIFAGSGNTGSASGTVSVSNAAALTGSAYTLSYDGTQYTLTRTSDNAVVAQTSSLPANADGLSINLSTTPNAGDSFTIQPSLRDNLTLTFITPGTYTAWDNTLGTYLKASGAVSATPVSLSYTNGGKIQLNGWTTAISGTPVAGDTFTLGPNTTGTNDGANASLLAGLQGQNTLLNGTATFSSAYAQLVDQVGAQTNQLQVSSQAQTNLLAQTTQTQQSLSGVNMDEEAANLIQYQQAYQAAGKTIQTAQTLFDAVLSLFR